MPIIRSKTREKRRDRRRAIPLTLEYDGRDFAVADCSLGGLAIKGGCGLFAKACNVTASLKIPQSEGDPCLGVSLQVVRNDPLSQCVAFHFSGLDERSFTLLERQLTGRASH
ncbi:MAG: PilZ domain-containing protein [Proteobacteria bacterium]|nr:PilZ domain-containing protein [Pseudomonadota bacterium]MDA1308792.1 PilZ domain-containing protein [Pseudomonadota bacterium]